MVLQTLAAAVAAVPLVNPVPPLAAPGL